MGELLIDLQTEIGRDGIDVLHHLGHLILVSHPLFLLQKEIKLHRKALWRTISVISGFTNGWRDNQPARY